MYRRTACINSPVQLSIAKVAGASSAGHPSKAASDLPATSGAALQGVNPQGPFHLRNAPAQRTAEPELSAQTHSAQHPAAQSTTPVAYRPKSIAQKAGMNVWSRHGSRYGYAPNAMPTLAHHAYSCAYLQNAWCSRFWDHQAVALQAQKSITLLRGVKLGLQQCLCGAMLQCPASVPQQRMHTCSERQGVLAGMSPSRSAVRAAFRALRMCR